MKEKVCCFTGYRGIEMTKREPLAMLLREEVKGLSALGVQEFRCGGAIGSDAMAAEAVLDGRNLGLPIRLSLILPCREQAKKWNRTEKERYQKILGQADYIEYTSEHYHQGCFHARNRRLIEDADICICYMLCTRTGTGYTVQKAQACGIEIINLVQLL